MELTGKEIKFLTIMNETRLSEGKILGNYSKEVREQFSFSSEELDLAVKKLVKIGMLSAIKTGKNEQVYFHTSKVTEDILDKDLMGIRH